MSVLKNSNEKLLPLFLISAKVERKLLSDLPDGEPRLTVKPVLANFFSSAFRCLKCLMANFAAELISPILIGGMTTFGGGGGLRNPVALPRAPVV